MHKWRHSFRGLFLLHEEPVQLQRTIRFVRADNHDNFPDNSWGTFQFQGHSVFELRAEVARRVGNVFMFFRILMCVQGGRYGRLTPLLVDLPRNEETVDIIVLIIGTEGDATVPGGKPKRCMRAGLLTTPSKFISSEFRSAAAPETPT